MTSEQISSLTEPSEEYSFIPDADPPLTKDETISAISELSVGTKLYFKKLGFGNQPLFTKADRHYVDPVVSGQDIALFSFVPCKDAKPNKYGVYGFAKIRGSFVSIDESDKKATELIQKHDSVHKIFHVKVGAPFPVANPAVSSAFAESVKEVDVKADAKDEISRFVKEASEKDKKVMMEIKERERQLREDVAKSPEQKKSEMTALDRYIFARKKISDNLFVFVEHRKKLHDVKKIILQAEIEANEIEQESPEVLSQFIQKYKKACEESGINLSNDRMAIMIRENFENKPNLSNIFSTDLV